MNVVSASNSTYSHQITSNSHQKNEASERQSQVDQPKPGNDKVTLSKEATPHTGGGDTQPDERSLKRTGGGNTQPDERLRPGSIDIRV